MKKQNGFALLVAVIFMSVMLALGLALGSLAYKQQILASNAIESQYAFYAADAALECALYYDQQLNAFDYASHSLINPPALIECDGANATQSSYSYNASKLVVSEKMSLDSGTRCSDITVYKPNPSIAGGVTYIFSQGYDVPCASVGTGRSAARGLDVHY